MLTKKKVLDALAEYTFEMENMLNEDGALSWGQCNSREEYLAIFCEACQDVRVFVDENF